MAQLTPDGNHKTAPAIPNAVTVSPDPAVQQAVNTHAKSKLKQANRKKNEFLIHLPMLLLNFESATVYQLSGFTPNSDNENFVLGQVELKVNGKGGSETILTFYPPAQQVISPGDTAPSSGTAPDTSTNLYPTIAND